MRLFLTIGITKKGAVEVIHGADEGRGFHRDEFQKMVAAEKKTPASSEYAEIRVVDISRGMVKRRRFAAFRLKGVDESGKRTVARTVKHEVNKAPSTRKKASKAKKAKKAGKGGKGPRRALGKLPAKKQAGSGKKKSSAPAKIAGPAKSDASASSTAGAPS